MNTFVWIYLIGIIIGFIISGYQDEMKADTLDPECIILWPLFIALFILISPFMFGQWLGRITYKGTHKK